MGDCSSVCFERECTQDQIDPEIISFGKKLEVDCGKELIYNCDRLILFPGSAQASKNSGNNLFKKDEAQIMVLFCLNQIGNHIRNPFNHFAISLLYSISVAHNL